MSERGAMPLVHRSKLRSYRRYTGQVFWGLSCSECTLSLYGDTLAEMADSADEHFYPALQWLLNGSTMSPDYGPGSFCPDCPFRDPAPSYQEREGYSIDNDPTEADYDCRLLGQKVWGEYSPCTEEQWKAQARLELKDLFSRRLLPG
ncbi:MAG: hypothetical protein WC054_00925 [Candidatus Nanopelagicales bacterium]